MVQLHAQLEKLDPVEAAQLGPHNKRYLTRSLELCLITQKPVSELRKDWQQPDPPGLRGLYFDWPREELAERIQLRTQLMLENGALQEVANLPENAPTASKAIGVSEIRRHLAGELSFEDTLELIATATRQYAKRQRTWFRKETWLKPVEKNHLPESLLQTWAKENLDNA